MPDLAPLKTKDGRFGYEAAGDPDRRRWCSCMESAARRGRGAANWIFSAIAIAPSPGTCRDTVARRRLRAVSIAALADALQDFLQQVGATKPILVGHSIGGMIVQQLLAKTPTSPAAVVLAQTSPAFGKPDGDWQKAFIEARLGPLDRGETHGLAGADAGEGIGRRRSRCRAAWSLPATAWQPCPRPPIAPPCWR